MDGLLLIDKPAGITSFDVVRAVRKLTNTRKVGHAGTLDPDATGLLAVAVGKCTGLISFLDADRKVYTFEMVLGTETDSCDSSGKVVRECRWEHIDEEDLQRVTEAFKGVIAQVPPIFSAVKVDGKRAYELARKGEDVELKARNIEIYEFEITGVETNVVTCKIACSPGTYVRSLARDVGVELGSCAHARAIRRTRIGVFSLEEARPLSELTTENVEEAMLGPSEMVAGLPSYVANPEQLRAVAHGQFLKIHLAEDVDEGDAVTVLDDDGELAAVTLVREKGDDGVLLRPKKVLL